MLFWYKLKSQQVVLQGVRTRLKFRQLRHDTTWSSDSYVMTRLEVIQLFPHLTASLMVVKCVAFTAVETTYSMQNSRYRHCRHVRNMTTDWRPWETRGCFRFQSHSNKNNTELYGKRTKKRARREELKTIALWKIDFNKHTHWSCSLCVLTTYNSHRL